MVNNIICPECNSKDVRQLETKEFTCNNCGFILGALKKVSNTPKELVTKLYFKLVPKETIINKKGLLECNSNTWTFNFLKETLRSVKGVSKDSTNKPWGFLDDECYYSYNVKDDKILFEINNGKVEASWCPVISITFLNSFPASKESLEEAIELVEKLGKKGLDFKIITSTDNNFVSIKKLNDLKKHIKNEKSK